MILQKREKVGLVGWLYWSPDEVGKSRKQNINTTSERLKLLEDLDVRCRVYGSSWYEELRNILQLRNDRDADKVHWSADENLRAFFKTEGNIDELKRNLQQLVKECTNNSI